MLNIPAALDQLGVTQELKAALLRLSAALPEARRRAEERIRQRIHLDSTRWFQAEEPLPHLGCGTSSRARLINCACIAWPI